MKEGEFVMTIWGWEGLITELEPEYYKFGQGVSIIRIDDSAHFCIHPTDILN